MPREELVTSAIAFLQDPSFVSAPLEKRIDFLRSKNLTQEEIDIALAKAAENSRQPSTTQDAPYLSSSQYAYPQSHIPGWGLGQNAYGPYRAWPGPPHNYPIEPPRRDWRDWFIMATVVSGAGFGLYTFTQRYIKPLIAPPTPPQLEQDKRAIDEEFSRAFGLLDVLSSDTSALKQAEEERTQRLDSALVEVENVVTELKVVGQRREEEIQRLGKEVRKLLKEGVPKAIDNIREGNDQRLAELSKELSSLRTVINNRLGTSGSNNQTAPPVPSSSISTTSPTGKRPQALSADASQPSQNNATSTVPESKSTTVLTPSSQFPESTTQPNNIHPNTDRSHSALPRSYESTMSNRAINSPSPFSPSKDGKPAIPAWQMAATNAKDKEGQGKEEQ